MALATAGHLRAVVPDAVLFARSAAEVPTTSNDLRPVSACHVFSGGSSDRAFTLHLGVVT